MSQQKYNPAFWIKPEHPIFGSGGMPAPPATLTLSTQVSSGAPGFTGYYKYDVCMDATGLFHTTTSTAQSYTSIGNLQVNIALPIAPGGYVDGARWIRVWRSTNGTNYYLFYQGPLPKVTTTLADRGTSSYIFTTVTNDSPTNTTAGWQFYDLRPNANTSAPYTANPYFNLADVLSVEYQTLASEPAEDLNRALIAKQFGARRKVRLRFSVRPGSVEEQQLFGIYNATLAYPDKSTNSGLRTFFTLNYSTTGGYGTASNIGWDEVIVTGDAPPRMVESAEEPLTRIECEMEVVNVNPSQTVPWANTLDGLSPI